MTREELVAACAALCEDCRPGSERAFAWRAPAGLRDWTEGWHHAESDCEGWDDSDMCDATDLRDEHDPTGTTLGGEVYDCACVCPCHEDGATAFGEDAGDCHHCDNSLHEYGERIGLVAGDPCVIGALIARADAAEARAKAAEAWRREVEEGVPGDTLGDAPQECSAASIVWGFGVLRVEVARLKAELAAEQERAAGWSQAAEMTEAGLRAEVERLHSWAGLMELLNEHWPESIFPTLADDEERDTGPRIVSLLRWVERLKGLVDSMHSARLLASSATDRIREDNERLTRERDEARKYGEQLYAERIAMQADSRLLTCVWCGQVYPPGTPRSNHESLRQHAGECSASPLAEANRLLERALGLTDPTPCCVGADPGDLCEACRVLYDIRAYLARGGAK